MQAFFLLSINLSYWFLTIDRQQEDYHDTATSLVEGVGLFQIPWAEMQMQSETRALMRHMARDRQSHLHFLVLSRRVMKAEALTGDKDPSPLSEDIFH